MPVPPCGFPSDAFVLLFYAGGEKRRTSIALHVKDCVFHPASCLFFLSVCGSSAGMLHKVWVFLCALVFLRASAFSRGLEGTNNASCGFTETWFNNEDQLIMLLLQSLSLRWTCQALIWSLCGKCNQCYTYHRWLGLIEALEWIEYRGMIVSVWCSVKKLRLLLPDTLSI